MKVEINLTELSQQSDQLVNGGDEIPYLVPTMNWSNDIAWNNREEIAIRPGLKLYIEKVSRPEPSYQFSIDHAPLEIGVLISGSCRCEIKHRKGNNSLQVSSGTNMITYFPQCMGIEEHANHPLISVGLYIDPKLVHDCLGFDEENLPKELMDIVNGAQNKNFYNFSPVNEDLRTVVNQILTCRLTGNLRLLYLEGKAIEFLATELDFLRSRVVNSGPDFIPGDEEKVRAAKDLLIQASQSPPTLFQIAKSVNLTHTRLNRGFRKLFGTTVFEYLRNYRLKKAKSLLLDTKMSITEIAHESGFSDSSHFSTQFFREFGIRPRQYRQTR